MSSLRICRDEDVGYWVRLPDDVRAAIEAKTKGERSTREVADVKIPRLSYSGVSRPDVHEIQSNDVFCG